MLTVATPGDLKNHVGEEMGVSEWVTIDQDMINKFAEATGDHQWIHVDVERAKRELPIGTTIAHGYLTLSLLPRLSGQIMKIETYSRGVNYGSNKVRFTGMVPAGSKVRMRSTLRSVEDVKGDGVRIIADVAMEMEGSDRPVMVAETIGISYA
jgi:acyl dehydratase